LSALTAIGMRCASNVLLTRTNITCRRRDRQHGCRPRIQPLVALLTFRVCIVVTTAAASTYK
jgi:hypothetical protein